MPSLRIRPAASVKILTAGALLAAGTASCALSDANAASDDVTVWTAVTKPGGSPIGA